MYSLMMSCSTIMFNSKLNEGLSCDSVSGVDGRQPTLHVPETDCFCCSVQRTETDLTNQGDERRETSQTQRPYSFRVHANYVQHVNSKIHSLLEKPFGGVLSGV